MKDHNKHIDEFFKERLGGYTEIPPPAVWDALEKRLDEKPGRRGFIFRRFWFAGILALIALVGGGGTLAWKLSGNSHLAQEETLKGENILAKQEISSIDTPNTPKSVQQPANKDAETNNNSERKVAATIDENKGASTQNDISGGETAISNEGTNNINTNQRNDGNKKTKTIKNAHPNPLSINSEKDITTYAETKVETVASIKAASNKDTSRATDILNANNGAKQEPAINQGVVNNVANDAKKDLDNTPEKKVASVKTEKQEAGTHASTKGSALKTELKPQATAGATNNKQKKGNKTSLVTSAVTTLADKTKDDKKKLEPVRSKSKPAISSDRLVAKNEHKGTSNAAQKHLATAVKNDPINANEGSRAVAKNEKEPVESGPRQTDSENSNSTNSAGTIVMEIPFETKLKELNSKTEEQKFASVLKAENTGAFNSNSSIDNKATENTGSLDPSSPASKINRSEVGIKAGFEGSFNGSAAKKSVISPYLQYNLSNKFSLLFQPSINVSKVDYRNLNGNLAFYNRNENSNNSTLVSLPVEGGLPPVLQGYIVYYTYSQTHDSISKTYASGGSYVEFQVPVMLKYNITPKLSVYGGVSLTVSKYIPTTEKTFNSKPISISDSVSLGFYPVGHTIPTASPIDSVLKYSGKPISAYSGPLYPSQSGEQFRFGLMLGFSYEFRKRWLFDVLVQQSSAKTYVQGGYDINSPLTLPYLRVTIGYKLGHLNFKMF